MKIKNVLLTFLLLLFASSFLAQAQEARTSDFLEYERIFISLDDTEFKDWPYQLRITDYRRLNLRRAYSFEDFFKTYPDSLLAPEAKFRAAALYLTIDNPGISELRRELYNCIDKAGVISRTDIRGWKVDFCENLFFLQTYNNWRNPVYVRKGVQMLLELIEKHGHAKRYWMFEPKLGGFNFIDEDIGGAALYLLVDSVMPTAKRSLYARILREYKIRPELQKEIEDSLDGH